LPFAAVMLLEAFWNALFTSLPIACIPARAAIARIDASKAYSMAVAPSWFLSNPMKDKGRLQRLRDELNCLKVKPIQPAADYDILLGRGKLELSHKQALIPDI